MSAEGGRSARQSLILSAARFVGTELTATMLGRNSSIAALSPIPVN